MIEVQLVLHKCNLTLGDDKNYVVFGPDGDFQTPENQHRPRPKLTLSPDEWKELGYPVSITTQVDEASTPVVAIA